MWNISQVKERGREAFRRNYWKSVLIALLASIIVAGGSGAAGGGVSAVISGLTGVMTSLSSKSESSQEAVSVHRESDAGESESGFVALSDEEEFQEFFNDYFYENGNPDEEYDYYWDQGDDFDYDIDYDWDDYDDFDEYDNHDNGFGPFNENFGPAAIIFTMFFFIILMGIFTIVFIISLVVDIFLFNPIEMGTQRFFYQNLSHNAEVKEVAYGFDRSYRNVVNVMFFKDLFIWLWSLLFIIPGIYKSYEYRMIPYILSEHPDMPREQAFATSKEMMNGNKWKAFVLDLSFIGWWILSAFTSGILELFYVGPYKRSTDAALYEAIKYEKGNTANGVVNNDTVYTAPEPVRPGGIYNEPPQIYPNSTASETTAEASAEGTAPTAAAEAKAEAEADTEAGNTASDDEIFEED